MILDLTTISHSRRERLRQALELNQSYYGEAMAIRSINQAYYNEAQGHWTFEFIGADGKIHYYGLFDFELRRDIAKIPEILEETPEQLVEVIEEEVRASFPTVFVTRDRKRSHVITFTYLTKNRSRIDWKLVQYNDKLVFANINFDGHLILIDKRVNDVNSALRVANRIMSDIEMSRGFKYA